MIECYDNIVGYSQNDCECAQNDRPIDYNESNSGLFLDDLAPISSLIGLSECDKTMWDILSSAKNSAIRQFMADSNALLGKRFKLKRKIVNSVVLGEIKAKDALEPTKNYSVNRVVCAPVRGGVWNLKKIGGVFSQDGTVSISIYDNVSGFLSSHSLNTVSNKHASVDVNLQLPLHSKYMQPLEYYFVYIFDQNNLPKDTELNCGCGGWTPHFNYDNPYFNNVGSHKSAPWADYIMLGGIQINSLSELEDLPTVLNNDMHGITLEGGFSCKVNEVLCEDSLDFIGNPLALSMAMAIQHLWGAKVASSMMKSSLLSRANMLNRDDWEDSAIEWTEKYNEHVNYIVSEADHTANDCLACKNVVQLARRGLFS